MLRAGKVEGIRWMGSAAVFPRLELDNARVLKRVHPEWPPSRIAFAAAGILASLGLDRRSWADGEDALSLAIAAARLAAAEANVPIDVVIAATSTAPGPVAAPVAADLGLSALAYDLRAGCAGGLLGLSQAADLVAGGATVLVVGTDTFSRVLPEDPMLQLATGDGAAAVVLGPGGTEARLSAAFTTEPAPGLVGLVGPLPPAVDTANSHRLSGDVLGFGDAALSLYGRVGTTAMLATGEVPGWLLPQQTTRPLIEALAVQFEIDRAWERVGRHGNIGAGNLLAAWNAARREGFCRPGTAGLCAVVGGGVTAGAVMWRC